MVFSAPANAAFTEPTNTTVVLFQIALPLSIYAMSVICGLGALWHLFNYVPNLCIRGSLPSFDKLLSVLADHSRKLVGKGKSSVASAVQFSWPKTRVVL